jgi:hypothetical protein
LKQAIAVKKVVLAKLPEENKDGWAQLEQDMNKESQKKGVKIESVKSEESSPAKKCDTPINQSFAAQNIN